MHHALFADRTEAGKMLAEKLTKYKDNPKTIIYALPRGGVPVGFEIARFLKAHLDLIITRKIGHPSNPEYAIAAVSESGELFENPKEVEMVHKSWYEKEVHKQQAEAKRRRDAYLGGKEGANAANKVAVLVDDGIATGLTMKAAVASLKKQGPEKIIVAVPVIPTETLKVFKKLVDEVVYVEADPHLSAIGHYYHNFRQVEDDEVIAILKSKKC